MSRIARIAVALAVNTFAAAGIARAAEPPASQPAAAEVRKIDMAEFDRMRQQGGVVILDVRTPVEFRAGHVPGAVNVPVRGPGAEQFDERAGQLDRGKTYLVMCAAGSRSPVAAARLAKMGFKSLADYAGGMNEWREAGKPVEK